MSAGHSQDTPQNAGIHVPPPLFFAVALGLGILVQVRAPVSLLPSAWRVVGVVGGWLLILVWLALSGWAIRTFRRAGTAVMPNRPATGIVTSGPYARSRNPMYVGLTALYLGVALLVNSVWPVLFLVPVLVILRQWVVRSEERYLAAAFKEEYEAYRARVRRWF